MLVLSLRVSASTTGLEFQLVLICNKEKTSLERIKKLEEALAAEKKRMNQLKRDLSTTQAELDVENYVQIQAEELSEAQKLQIEPNAMEHYKGSREYRDKLGDYAVRAHLACLNNVIQIMIKKGV